MLMWKNGRKTLKDNGVVAKQCKVRVNGLKYEKPLVWSPSYQLWPNFLHQAWSLSYNLSSLLLHLTLFFKMSGGWLNEHPNIVHCFIQTNLQRRFSSPSCFRLNVPLEVASTVMKTQRGEALLVLCHDRVVLLSTYCAVFVQLNQPHIHHILQRSE